MPMINLPTAPTNPALGKSSNAISQGYIDSELQPFVKMGGAITQDPGSLSFAGQARLGRHIFLKSPEEQKRIMGEIKTSRLNQYINERLGEGFTKASASRLQRREDGMTRFLDVDWATGNINETTLNDATGSTTTRRVDPLAAKVKVLQGIESGKIKASSSATENLKVQLGLSTPTPTTNTPTESPLVYNGQGYSVSNNNMQSMINQIAKSNSSNSSSKTPTTTTPSYSNGGISFSNSYSNVNVSSNLNKAIGTSPTPSTTSNAYKVTTPSVYSTPTIKTTTPTPVKTQTTAQKVTSALTTKLSNSKVGQVTKAISSLIKKK